MSQRRLDAAACADGTRRGADVSPNCDIAAHGESTDGIFTVEDDDKVGDIGTYLKAPTETTGCDARGSRP